MVPPRTARWVGLIACLASLLESLLSAPLAAGPWTLGGQIGLEVDGLGEEFQNAGLFDERLIQDGSVDLELEQQPIRSRETALLGVLHLELRAGDRQGRWLELVEIGRLGTHRSSSSLRLETGLAMGENRIRIENQWDAQGGEEAPAAGKQNSLSLVWDRDSLPLGLESQVRTGAEWSESADDTLAALFDYRILRGQAELRRSIGSRMDVRALAGIRRKEAFRSPSGSYDALHAQVESSARPRPTDRIEASLRAERRDYRDPSLGIPSSRTLDAELRYRHREGGAMRPYASIDGGWQDYARASSVFQDHREWRIEAGANLDPGRLFGGRSPGAFEAPGAWRVRLAAGYRWFDALQGSADSLSLATSHVNPLGIVEVAYEGGSPLWTGLTVEAGRREYLGGAAAGSLTFEGIQWSLSTTDYTYLETSLLLHWTPVAWLRQELFVQWNEEWHDRAADDFRLWIVNLSVSYPF